MRRAARRQVPESPRGYKPIPSTPDMVVTKSEFTPSPHLLDHGYGATPQNQLMSTHIPSQAPAVKRKLNMDPQHIVVPIKQEFKPPQPRKPKRASPTKKNTRYDTSLGLLTKKFTALLEKSPNGVVDLNKASTDMKVPKRRIYDITNVLEGIGILEKKSKNNIQWKGGSKTGYSIAALRNEVQALEDRENKLDELIRTVTTDLQNLNNSKHGYVTYHDIRSIPKYKSKTVMAIKAPPNARLIYQEDVEDGYEIQLKSDTGEIDVFLCPENVSPPKVKNIPVPPMDMLLKDLTSCPDIFNVTTPPVPQFDSPTQDIKPLTSQICRKISFTKDLHSDNVGVPKPTSVCQSITFNGDLPSDRSSESMLSSINLSPITNILNNTTLASSASSDRLASPLIHSDDYTLDKYELKGEETDSSGMLDPMFCGVPSLSLITLEPFGSPEYSYGMDACEGLADLYNF